MTLITDGSSWLPAVVDEGDGQHPTLWADLGDGPVAITDEALLDLGMRVVPDAVAIEKASGEVVYFVAEDDVTTWFFADGAAVSVNYVLEFSRRHGMK